MNRATARWMLPEFLEPPGAARNVLSSQTCEFRKLRVGLISALPGGAASCEDGEIRRRRLDPCWRLNIQVECVIVALGPKSESNGHFKDS